MAKKICSVILTVVVLLYAVSIHFVFKLGMDAKFNEYYDRDTEASRYGMEYYLDAYKSGELSTEGVLTGLCEYDRLITKFPLALYNAVIDTEGNIVAESSSLLEVKFYDIEPSETYFISLEPYITEEVKKQILEHADKSLPSEYWIDKIELYREGDTIIPVAFTCTEVDDNYNDVEYRIVLSDAEPNVTSHRGKYEECYFRFFANNLENKMKKHHEYLKGVAEEYRLEIMEKTDIEEPGTGGGGEPFFHSEYSHNITSFKLDGKKYYLFSGEAANTVLSVISDEDYIKAFITITAVYLVLGGYLCYYGVKLYNKKEENEKYKDKYTGIV